MFDESLAAQAIVRIGSAPRPHGTGVFVGDRVVLTCHHVAASGQPLVVTTADGRTLTATIDSERSVPACDVAVLRTDGDGPAVIPMSRAPVAIGERLWSRGFQLQSDALRSALPVTGTNEGTTTIRYRGMDRNYEIAGAIRITALTNPGASGGPLLTEEGVVVGLVSSKFEPGGGFAIPLSLAAAEGSAFAELVDEQNDRVAAFGRYLNRAGARVVCGRIRQRVLQRLVDRGQYLPDYVVGRSELFLSFRRFRSQRDTPLMIVSGPSGTGKSFAIAALASGAFSILLTADHFRTEDASIRENVAREADLEPDDVDRLAEVCRGELLLMVDGLNEMRGSIAGVVRPWIERSFEWLQSHGAKMIVTLRDDFWRHLEKLVPQRTDAVFLGAFNDDELAEAAERYGVALPRDDDPLLHLPLVLRLQKELGNRAAGSSGIRQLVRQFIAEKENAISRAVDPPVPPQMVHVALRQLAARVDPAEGLAITAEELFASFPGQPALASAVLSENLIVAAGDAFRFGFDTVAEWLAGEQRPLPAAESAAWAALLAPSPWLAPLRFQILALEGTPAFDETLQAILGVAERTDDPEVVDLASFLVLIVLQSARVVAARHVTKLADRAHGVHRIEPRLTVDVVARSSMSGRERIRTARGLAPTEDPYDWEWGHWIDRDFDTFVAERSLGQTSWRSFMAIVADALDGNDYLESIDELLGWIGDRTPLQDGRAVVEDVAAAFLFHYRDRDFDYICDTLAEFQHAMARRLLQAIARADRRVVDALKRWSDLGLPWWDELCAGLLQTAIDAHRDAESVSVLGDVVRALIARDNGIAADKAIAAAGTLDGFDMLDILEPRFLANAAGVSGSAFRPYVRERFDDVARILRRYFGQENRSLAEGALAAIANVDGVDGVPIVAFLAETFDTQPDLRTAVARAVELRLHKAGVDTPEWEALVELTRRVIREAPSVGVSSVVYFLSSHNRTDGKEAARRELIRLAVDECRHPDARRHLFNLLVERYSAERADFETVFRLAESLEGDAWKTLRDRLPFAAKPLLEIAADRVQHDPRAPRELHDAVEAGMSAGATPAEALLHVVAPWK